MSTTTNTKHKKKDRVGPPIGVTKIGKADSEESIMGWLIVTGSIFSAL